MNDWCFGSPKDVVYAWVVIECSFSDDSLRLCLGCFDGKRWRRMRSPNKNMSYLGADYSVICWKEIEMPSIPTQVQSEQS